VLFEARTRGLKDRRDCRRKQKTGTAARGRPGKRLLQPSLG
jgi:hypothetical protein